MVSFDFITGKKFRASLESDYKELTLAMKNEAWKTVHVLAGSIIEAVLIDYLVFSDYQSRTSIDPLKLSLDRAISACRAENVLSERTEHLTHVIRSYRNLIHPGRSVRLGETATENGATVAYVLVEMVVEEVTSLRKKNYGYTAEQILTKIEKDSSAMAIIVHLLKETNNYEKERLLLDLIPSNYSRLTLEEPEHHLLRDLVTCFRATFDLASQEIKTKAAKEFVRIIKEESSYIEWRYAFFKGNDLYYLEKEEASLVKEHLFSILDDVWRVDTEIVLRSLQGIGAFLEEKDASTFAFCLIFELSIDDGKPNKFSRYSNIMSIFKNERSNMNKNVSKAVDAYLIDYYQKHKSEENGLAAYAKDLYETTLLQSIDNDVTSEEASNSE